MLLRPENFPRLQAKESYRGSRGLTTGRRCLHQRAGLSARMMKQILLRIAAVFTEISLTKSAQLRRSHFSFPRKIFLPQDPLDPHVDRERAQPLVGEEHHTISN